MRPFADAEQLRVLIDRDLPHRALYQVFLDVRDAAAKILENTTLADLISGTAPASQRQARRQQEEREGKEQRAANGRRRPEG